MLQRKVSVPSEGVIIAVADPSVPPVHDTGVEVDVNAAGLSPTVIVAFEVHPFPSTINTE